MQKVILIFVFSLFLMGCKMAQETSDQNQLKNFNEKDKSLLEILSAPYPSNEREWKNGYHFDHRYWVGFNYPPIFKAIQKDKNSVDLVYKDQPGQIFIAIEPVAKDSNCLMSGKIEKTVKTIFHSAKIQNVAYGDGRIAREACVISDGHQFKMTQILSMDAGSGQKDILRKIEKREVNELVKKEIELFDKIISTFSGYE